MLRRIKDWWRQIKDWWRQIKDWWRQIKDWWRQIKDWWRRINSNRIMVNSRGPRFLLAMVSTLVLQELTPGSPGFDLLWTLLAMSTITTATLMWTVHRHGYEKAFSKWQDQMLATLLGWATAWVLLITADEIGIGTIAYIF